jgi:hypothetical protein
MVPNALIDSMAFDDTDKLVYVVLRRHAIGDKTDVWPSQVRIAALARKGRDSVRSSLHKLTEAGIVSEVGRDARKKATYRLHLDVDLSKVNLTQNRQVPDLESPGNLTQNRHQADIAEHTNKKYASPRLASSSLSDAEMTSGESVDGTADSAASPESTVPLEIEVNTSPGYDKGNAEALPTLPASNGRSNLLQSRDGDAQDAEDGFDFGPPFEWGPSSESTSRSDVAGEILDEIFGPDNDPEPQKSVESAEPEHLYGKSVINKLMLTPKGEQLTDDEDELRYEVEALILPGVYGEPFNPGDLDKLVAARGVPFCRMWIHWLGRKIASAYERGRPVSNPSGLYLRAVEQGWEVDPKWPQFNEVLHTVAAREEYRKRQEAERKKRALSALPTLTRDENKLEVDDAREYEEPPF